MEAIVWLVILIHPFLLVPAFVRWVERATIVQSPEYGAQTVGAVAFVFSFLLACVASFGLGWRWQDAIGWSGFIAIIAGLACYMLADPSRVTNPAVDRPLASSLIGLLLVTDFMLFCFAVFHEIRGLT